MTSGAFFLIVQTVNVKASLAVLMGFSIGMNETEGVRPCGGDDRGYVVLLSSVITV